jgi:hypothetical protein
MRRRRDGRGGGFSHGDKFLSASRGREDALVENGGGRRRGLTSAQAAGRRAEIGEGSLRPMTCKRIMVAIEPATIMM